MTADPIVAELVRSLEMLFQPDSAALARVLRGRLRSAALLERAHFEEERYVRIPLHVEPRFEVRLLCWRPGQSSALHEHGRSACAFRVIAGTATEFGLDRPDRTLHAGDVGEAEPDVIHQVTNLGPTPLVTLHVYAPPLPVDQPSPASGRQVAVIGGGLCGAAVAIRLLESEVDHLRLHLIERSPGLGRGVAYGTTDPAHLLNVPAGQMSLDPAEPDAFVAYAHSRGAPADADALLPRRLYGDYVVSRLHHAVTRSRGRLRIARGEALDLAPLGGAWEVLLDSGDRVRAERVVLATGHALPRVPEGLLELRGDRGLIRDPWTGLGAISRDARLLIVGTGLTALDVLSTLRNRGHRGPITALSRHGRWPRPHLPGVTWNGEPWEIDLSRSPRTADGLAGWLRSMVEAAEARQIPWQAVITALKPHTPELWARLDPIQRVRFLHHHRPLWEVVRHRAPLPLCEARAAWEAEGWLRAVSGRVLGARRHNGSLLVDVRDSVLEVDHVVLCTGAESDVRRVEDPLWRSLVARGLVVPDPLGLGILTDDQNGVIGLRGPVGGLWAIGGLLRPRLFESTSVPDLALQAQQVGAVIADWYAPRAQDWLGRGRMALV